MFLERHCSSRYINYLSEGCASIWVKRRKRQKPVRTRWPGDKEENEEPLTIEFFLDVG
jgi:hypothetical protein